MNKFQQDMAKAKELAQQDARRNIVPNIPVRVAKPGRQVEISYCIASHYLNRVRNEVV